jgi:hypothetical protein
MLKELVNDSALALAGGSMNHLFHSYVLSLRGRTERRKERRE